MTGYESLVAALFLFWGVILPVGMAATAFLQRCVRIAAENAARRDARAAADWAHR